MALRTLVVFVTVALVGWRLLGLTAHATRYLDYMRRYPACRYWPGGRTAVWRHTR